MGSSEERSFMTQNEAYHTSGGDLDALVFVNPDGSGGVRIEDDIDDNMYGTGQTRLHCAARERWSTALSWLVERGADVNLGWPCLGWKPLHFVAMGGQCESAVRLIDEGATVGDHGVNGYTALHGAAYHGHPKMCMLLLSRGASLEVRDKEGRYPEGRARIRGRPALADFLAAVRVAGGWTAHLAARRADRAELLSFRRALPTRRRSAPCAARVQARLFLDVKVSEHVFVLVLEFWRSHRDY